MSDTPAPAPDDQLPEVTPTEAEGATGRRRLRALWAVLAVIAVGVGAVAVNSADDDPPRLPVALGAGSAAPESAMADSSMLANIVYVAGPELPGLGADARAYRLSGTTDAAAVQRVAKALGLEGEPVRDGKVWRVTDGTHTLEVNPGLGSSWWYGDTSATTSSSAVTDSGHCAEEVAPDGVSSAPSIIDCGSTTTIARVAADLPPQAEARRIALELLEATGVDTGAAIVTVDGPYEGWYVNVEPTLDGTPTGLHSSVTVGPNGTIQWASGTIAEATLVGTYQTVDTATAIERLNAGHGGFASSNPGGAEGTGNASSGAAIEPAMEPVAEPSTDPAVDLPATDPATTAAPEPGATGCTATADGRESCTTTAPPACPDSVQAPVTTIVGSEITPEEAGAWCAYPSGPVEPIEVVLEDAEPILMLTGTTDGSDDGYLVPGYRFTGADGVLVDQMALADGALAPVDPPDVDDRPDPAPGQIEPAFPTDTAVPAPAGGGSPGYDPDGSASSPAGTDPGSPAPPETTVPCTMPEPGPNGEVPLIGCAEAPPAG